MLTSEQARQNQEKYGFNELVEGKKKSTLQIFLEQYKDFLVIILIIAAIVSGFLGDFWECDRNSCRDHDECNPGNRADTESGAVAGRLKQMSAPEAKVIRDGVVKQIPSREVTIGDRVLLEAGDCVPADGNW